MTVKINNSNMMMYSQGTFAVTITKYLFMLLFTFLSVI